MRFSAGRKRLPRIRSSMPEIHPTFADSGGFAARIAFLTNLGN
jgi:hypothetical protein